MPKFPLLTKTSRTPPSSNRCSFKEEEIAAAELALKAHVLSSERDILADVTDGDAMMRKMANAVDLTEAPEDAVASLVIDLLHYCEREKIDWTEDVMSRVRRHLHHERVHEVQKR